MLKQLLVFLLLALGSKLTAQTNLVPNYSFEELDSCPYLPDDYFVVKNWYNPNNSSPDIYNDCNTSPTTSVPINWMGFQYAQDGSGYAGILVFAPSIPNYREYIAVKLTDSLKFGMNYCLKFYVSLSEAYPKYISSIGVHFSPDSIHQDNWNTLPFMPQFQNFNGNFINDTTSWMLIKGNYTASGGEKYIYIGNFKNDANTVVDSSSVGSRTYMYIDNVQLYECDSLIGIKEEPVVPLRVYPNPTTTTVSIEIPSNYPNSQLYIYNLTGQLVAIKPVQSNVHVPITELSAGMFIFAIQSNNMLIGREKVVVY